MVAEEPTDGVEERAHGYRVGATGEAACDRTPAPPASAGLHADGLATAPAAIRCPCDGAGSLGRRIPRDDLLPRVPDRRVPAARPGSPTLVVARRRDARRLARVGRRDAEAARGRRARRARRAQGGDPHRDRPDARRARRAQAPDHRAAADRLHGLHGGRGARPRRRARRHVHRRHGRADRGAARQPRPLPARLAGRHRLRAGREPRARAAVGDSSRAAARRSSGSPSTTATCCTGSTTRASSPARRVELDAAEPAAGQFRVRLDGGEKSIGENAAAGLFVRPTAAGASSAPRARRRRGDAEPGGLA